MAGYVLKIGIEDTHPPVWRRIIIPEKITFADLHEMIQILFGWEDQHLHEFRIPSKYICIDDSEQSWDRYHYMEKETPVDRFLLENKWVRYTYDFGDEWRHKILYEKTDETYNERYASLVKFKGDNFVEDFGGICEEEDTCSSSFNPGNVEEQLKNLVCPVCERFVEIKEEKVNAGHIIDRLVEQLSQNMEEAMRPVSQIKNKIDVWKDFVENWDEKNGDTWEIIASERESEKMQGKTNRELLQSLNYTEAKDYCKYLQISILDTWTKEQMTNAVADTFAEHPEYFLYVFFRDEYAEFVKLMKNSRGVRREKPETPDIWIKGAALGLVDISVTCGEKGNRAEISFASDIKTLLLSMNAKERNTVYRKVESFSDNLRKLILFYGIVELEELFKMYCQIYHVSMEKTEFYRYIYWYGRFNNLILTATTQDGISYAASPEIDLDAVSWKMKKYSHDLEYAVYSAKELKKMTNDISKRSEWLNVLFTCLHFQMRLPEVVAGSIVEEIFSNIMNGKTLPEVLEHLYEMLDAFGVQAELFTRCEIWECISGLMLELEIPMLKGRSRNEYGKEKNVSPWTVGMCETVGDKIRGNSRMQHMQEFSIEKQEMMYDACSFVDAAAMKGLIQYWKNEKIQSEEFVFLLARALTTGCEFERASEVLRKLENGSQQAKKSAGLLRMRLEQGEDVVDEPWEPENEPWEFMESFQKPYVREERKIGRNEPCSCGSGKKYKHCCGK